MSNIIEIDLDRLRQKLSGNEGCFVLRSTKEIEHIFDELYHVDPRVQKGYFRIKVLELPLSKGVMLRKSSSS
ncbi:hypothetical protein NE464_22350, partial [Eubacterium callanderi]|nr:hypothetical protein [Eubacterium callanderi]